MQKKSYWYIFFSFSFRFEEGASTILTLKDSCILDGEEDTLVNVNIVDSERAEKVCVCVCVNAKDCVMKYKKHPLRASVIKNIFPV